jgi:hypothetical protein
MELTGPTPKWSDLIAHGMADYSLRAVEFDPPVGSRGIQAENKPTSWSCTITSTSASRPMIRALRDNPDEADRDARLRFMAIFAKGKKLDTISANPKQEKKPKPKPAAKVELDDEASSLI